MGFLNRTLPILLLLALQACQGLQISQGIRLSPAAWPSEGAGNARLQSVDREIRPPLQLAWVYKAVAGFGPGSPLIVGDVVVIANRKGEVHTVRKDNGHRLGMQRFGDAIEGTPVLAREQLIIPISWGGKALVAVTLRTGNVSWVRKGAPVEAGLLYTDDLVIAADIENMVRAFNAADGSVRWEFQIPGPGAVHAAPVLTEDGNVIVADDQGTVVALDSRTGRLAWSVFTGLPVYSPGASYEGMVLLSGTRGRLLSLSARDGTPRWTYAVADSTIRFSAPSVAQGRAYLAGSDGVVRAIRLGDGVCIWTFQTKSSFAAAPLSTGGVVYVGGLDRKLYALDSATGTLLWEKELRGRIKSALAAAETQVFVLAEPNLVYSFKSE